NQCVGNEVPLTLNQVQNKKQCVGRETPWTLPCNMNQQQCVGETIPLTLKSNSKRKIRCKLEDQVLESMYPPLTNQSVCPVNVDPEYPNFRTSLKDPTRLASTSPIGILTKSKNYQEYPTQQTYLITNNNQLPIIQQPLHNNQQILNKINPKSLPSLIQSQPKEQTGMEVQFGSNLEHPLFETHQNLQITQLLEDHQASINWPIGARLIHFIETWKLIKADMLITRGIKAYWISKQAPSILERNKTIPNQRKSQESEQALGLLIQKELQEKIVEEVSFNQLKWINPCFAIPKKEQGKWRKITDCSLLNQHLLSTHFIMEDIQSLRLLLQPKDFMIRIDLESAFHHIQVDTEFRPFLGFTFNNKFYQYRAMCFGVKHAPLIFHKTLRPVIKFIREVLQVRIIAYCDDIIILHQNLEELNQIKHKIINILSNFGFKISMDKSVLIPQMRIEFLGWSIDSNLDQLSMTITRQMKMKQM
ncbi:MAG: putative reverse transcriptase, partial [Streblomastix strix]